MTRLGPDTTGDQQLELLVSKRDRMVSIYRPSDNPIYKHGEELIASVIVRTEPDGGISIALAHKPTDLIDVVFIDEEDDQ